MAKKSGSLQKQLGQPSYGSSGVKKSKGANQSAADTGQKLQKVQNISRGGGTGAPKPMNKKSGGHTYCAYPDIITGTANGSTVSGDFGKKSVK